MNNTKWEEIRRCMIEYPRKIKWRTKDIKTNYISSWDVDWYYHFKLGGYESIEWLEIQVINEGTKLELVNKLRAIHVPGEVLDSSIMIYGFVQKEAVNYI
jgi:hypothetical protein